MVIANTSNMPVMAREASIYTGMTVAEYYRDMGYDVVLLADSTSRWAEALREFSSRQRRAAGRGGLSGRARPRRSPPSTSGPGGCATLGGAEGSVTAIGAVSPPGGDMTEPVTAHTERFVRCLWSLDRDLAYARHYPAVTWRRSFSPRRRRDRRLARAGGRSRLGARTARGLCASSPRPTGWPRWSSSSASRRCPPTSGWLSLAAGCFARRCSSRAR